MTVRERILALHLAEKLEKNPQYANKIGVSVSDKSPAHCEKKVGRLKDV